MIVRRPAALMVVSGKAGEYFARLNAMEGMRSLIIGIIPLLALDVLGTKEKVTQAYLLGSVLTLAITLNFALLEKLIQRRWVMTLGVGLNLAAIGFLLSGSPNLLMIAIGLQQAAASIFSVCLSLYIMDHIGKKDLIYTETRRMLYTGAVWLVGPTLGLWLWDNAGHWTPLAAAAVSSVLMLAYFWYLRIAPQTGIQKAKSKSVNIFKIIPRYFAQKSLRIAYWITLSRSIFWVTLFVYGPIYVVEAGLPKWMAGVMLSAVSALLMISPFIRRIAGRFSTRRTIIGGLVLTSASIMVLYLLGEPRPAGVSLWFFAAIGGVTLDVLGNIPFMRTVKPRERTEMTMIFSTWREGSQLLTPLLVSLVLLVAPFEMFYLLLAAVLLSAAVTASFLPRRL
ncbi:MAG: MFS transporter [Pseudomonadota bacterium]